MIGIPSPVRTLAMELVELDELQQAFRSKALVDRDVAAGALLVKAPNVVQRCSDSILRSVMRWR